MGVCSQYKRSNITRTSSNSVSLKKRQTVTDSDYATQVAKYYQSLKQSASSPTQVTNLIKQFYTSSFIPKNISLSPAAVAQLGMDQAEYTQFVAEREAMRKDLAAKTGFPYKTYQEVKAANGS